MVISAYPRMMTRMVKDGQTCIGELGELLIDDGQLLIDFNPCLRRYMAVSIRKQPRGPSPEDVASWLTGAPDCRLETKIDQKPQKQPTDSKL